MKNKPQLLFFTALLLFNTAFSQEINIGLKGGINNNFIEKLYHVGTAKGGGVNLTPSEDTFYKADSKIGTNFGFFAKLNFDRLFIQAEINSATLKNSYPLALKTANWEATTIDVPLLVGYKFFEPFAAYIGPGLRMINDMKLDGVEYPIEYNKSGLGINAGILVDLGILDVDFRYVFGLPKEKLQRIDIVRATYGTNVAYLYSYNPAQLYVTVNIKILRFNSGERRNRSGFNWRNHKNL